MFTESQDLTVTGFYKQEKRFELNLLIRKTFL